MRALWRNSRGRVQGRLQRLEDAAAALVTGSLQDDERQEAQQEAHRLAGTLGTLGIPAATDHARILERRLERGPPYDDEHIHEVSDHVVALLRLVQEHDEALKAQEAAPASDAAPSQERPTAPGQTSVWFVGEDPTLVERLDNLVGARGWTLRTFASSRAARRRLELPIDHLIARGGDRDALARLIEAARRHHPALPILVLGDEADLDTRVAAARAGADRYLAPDLPPRQLLDTLDRLQGAPQGPARILVVDDDPVFLQMIEGLLGDRHDVRAIAEPSRFWNVLEDHEPDLILLDLDMPGHDGFALGRALRTDPRWAPIPVVFVTAQRDPAVRERIWDAGGDALVEKPLDPQWFGARLTHLLRRSETMRHATRQDPDTGTLDTQAGKDTAARLATLAEREGRPLSVAVVAGTRHSTGAALDEAQRRLVHALQRALSATDVVYRDEGQVIAVSYGTEREALAEQVQHALQTVLGEAPAHGAAAGLGLDGETLAETIQNATRTVPAGGRSGIVHLSGDGGSAVERPDVVVVDDDETIAALLRHALESNGYGMHWIPDGEEALRLLGGPTPALRPRLILLDVNLPGLDGLSLLRRLRDDHILDRTNVIMLTARSLDGEIVKALQLGADDHIAKPFSMPVLLQRVQRTLEG